MKRLRKFLRLSSSDRYLFVNTLFLLSFVRLGLWLLPFQKLRNLLANITSTSAVPNDAIPIHKIIWAVESASRYMPGVKCLARALVTQMLLSQYGYPHDLRIGVAKGATGHLEAHAWVESQGKVVMGRLTNLSRYMPLPSLEREGL